jgi:hypothetical protein
VRHIQLSNNFNSWDNLVGPGTKIAKQDIVFKVAFKPASTLSSRICQNIAY